ncbi:MAG: hypothetical protein HY821_12350 [Acidobacteria bacterium]|nr:hypothetical protein [Acidobacteriota bacterium]
MLNNSIRWAVPLGSLVLALALAPPASAQGPTYVVRADIPFDFQVGQQKLPAGEYRIQPFNLGAIAVSSVLPRTQHATSTVFPAGGGKIAEETRLIFERYGDRYFLKQVWRAGTNTGAELPKTKDETAAIYRAGHAPERVVLEARTTR